MDYILVVAALVAVEMFNFVISNAWSVAVAAAATGTLVSLGMRHHDDRRLVRNITR
jgi:hypothetical protein